MDSINKGQDSKFSPIIERDVLGQEKNRDITLTKKAKPNRIFIVSAILMAIAIIYWIITK